MLIKNNIYYDGTLNHLIMEKWDLLSPDGISIQATGYFRSKEEAEAAFDNWKSHFAYQGYYLTSNWTKIPLDKLRKYCSLIRLN